MMDQDTAFRLYRQAQQFLDLNSDEAIDPRDYEDGVASEIEQLIAGLAFAMNEATPQVDCDTDNEFRTEACKRWPHDDSADMRGAFIDGAAYGYGFQNGEPLT